MLQLAFATMPRSGSEFVIKLTRFVMGDNMPGEVVSLTPGRIIQKDGALLRDVKDGLATRPAADVFRDLSIRCVKLESPGIDTLAYDLASSFPQARWLGSVRTIEKIITSHFNIKKWGWSEERILRSYVSDLAFYEHVAVAGRLFLVDIDKPEGFSLRSLLSFLGVDHPGQRAPDFVEKWYVVNPLTQQRAKAGEDVTAPMEIPPGLETLRERHPWVADIERRYHALCEQCAAVER